MLSLRLLGPLEITWQGRSVEGFPTDKIRALLVYLSMEPNRPHRRDHLATLFWSDFDDEIARRNLRQSLHRLRRVFEQVEEGLCDRLLLVTRQSLELCGEFVESDALELMELLKGDFPTQMDGVLGQRWLRASREIRGDFLEGFSLGEDAFDEWLEGERQRLHLGALELSKKLMRSFLGAHRFSEATEQAQLILRREAWDEEAHRVLMRSLAMTGQRAAALAQYERCCAILDRELGVEPEDETLELLEQIQEGEFEDDVSLPPPAQSSVSLPRQRSRFVGRSGILEQVERELLLPNTRMLTLLGPGGIGKTRLALALAQRWQEREQHPFSDGVFFVSLEGVDEKQRLSSLLTQSLGLTFDAKGEQNERIKDFLRPRQLLLIWDHPEYAWISEEFLMQILDEAPHVKVLVTAHQPFKLSYERCLVVEEMTEAEALELFAQRAREIDAGFSLEAERESLHRVYGMVGGYPLAIELAAEWVRLMGCEEIAEELAQDLALLDSETEQRPLRHRSMRGLLSKTWQQLSLPQQEAMQKLSVFAGSFSLQAARQLMQIPLRVLAGLSDRSLLQRSVVGRYQMHPLWKRFASEQFSQSDAKEVLERSFAAYFLEGIEEQARELFGESSQEARVALREELENLRRSWQLASGYREVTLLGRGLLGMQRLFHQMGLFAEGFHLFGQALEGLRHPVETSEEALRARLLGGQAWFCLLRGDTAQARALFLQIRGQGGAKDEEAERLRLSIHLHMAQGEFSQALASFDQGGWIEDLEVLGRLDALCSLGQLALQTGDYVRAVETLESALEEARARRLPMVMVQALLTLGMVEKEQGELPQARVRLMHACELAVEHGLPIEQIRSFGNLGVVERHLGNYEEAGVLYRRGLALAQELGMRGYASHFLQNLGVLASLRGDFVLATDYFHQTLCLEEETKNQGQISIALGNLGDIYRQLGDLEKATMYLQRSLLLERSLGRQAQIATRLGNLGEVEKARGAWETAVGYFEEAISLMRPLQQRSLLSWLLLARAEGYLEQEAWEQAQASLDEGLAWATEVGRKEKVFEGRLLQAQCFAGQGRVDEAQRVLSRLEEQIDSPEYSALLHDLRWRLWGEEKERLSALQAYQEAEALTPKASYAKRIQHLSLGA
ncbi:MAG: tetratricopeptide repeat protein [Myxococcales bacterium]|nr:tetratricopeptide repeat protein [Myxococcales bacterium]